MEDNEVGLRNSSVVATQMSPDPKTSGGGVGRNLENFGPDIKSVEKHQWQANKITMIHL